MFGRKTIERAVDDSWSRVAAFNGRSAYGYNYNSYINPYLAENVSAVFAAIEVITNAIATLPPKLYRYEGANRTRVDDHPLQPLLRKPNEHSTWPEFIRDYLADVLLHGNACAVFIEKELIFIPWRQVYVDQSDTGKLRYRYTRPMLYGNEQQYTAMEDEVLHVKDRGDGILGVPRLSRCASTVNLSIVVQEAAENIFRQGVFPSGMLSYKGKLDPKKRRDLFADLQNQFGSSTNRGKVMLLDNDLDYKIASQSPESMEFVETRKFLVDEIARVFNVSPIMLGKLDNASYSNASQMARHLEKFTLQYWSHLFESAFNDLFLMENECLDLDLSVFVRGDPTERWNAYKIALAEGVLSPEDVRRLEGWQEFSGKDNKKDDNPVGFNSSEKM